VIRSETYALGLTLHELLALRPVFDQSSRNALVDQVLNSSVKVLGTINRDIPSDLAIIIHKAIDRDPTHRYQTGRDFADDLQRFVDDEPIKARRVSEIEQLGRWARRNSSLATSLAVLVTLISLFAFASAMAAGYFRNVNRQSTSTVFDLKKTQGDLKTTLDTLTTTSRDLATSRNEAEKRASENLQLAEAARLARNESLAMLADTQTERGLQAGRDGDAATAALWFANSTALTPDDPDRQLANRQCARNCSKHLTKAQPLLQR
jgi:serine/threonine protein kinase